MLTITLKQNPRTTIKINELLDIAYGCYLWPSALTLTAYLLNQPNIFLDKKILELGAGVSFPGILLATLGAHVTLSDLDSELIQENIRYNLELNGVQFESLELKKNELVNSEMNGHASMLKDPNPQHNRLKDSNLIPSVSVYPFEWANFERIEQMDAFDLIIGADLFYDPSAFEPLLVTVYALLAKSLNSIFLTAYHERSSRRNIVHLLEKYRMEGRVLPFDTEIGYVFEVEGRSVMDESVSSIFLLEIRLLTWVFAVDISYNSG